MLVHLLDALFDASPYEQKLARLALAWRVRRCIV